MNWDRERRLRPLRSPRVGDLEAEGGYTVASDPWRTRSPDQDSPVAQRRREERQRDRILLRQRRQLLHDRDVLVTRRDSLAAEQAYLKLMRRRIKRARFRLTLMRRLGLGLLWSSLSGALARNDAARQSYLARLEQHVSVRTSWEAELERNSLALEHNRIELSHVRG